MIPNWEPTPLELAAYFDGELPESDAERVAVWLRDHPEVTADAEADARLLRLWERTAAPEPSPESWTALFQRIAAVTPPSPLRFRRASRLAWMPFALLAVAAALLVAVTVGLMFRPKERAPGPIDVPSPIVRNQDPSPDEAFPVATSDDVEIISMDDNDHRALVVGAPPVRAALPLLEAGEVTMDKIERDDDGMEPHYSGDEAKTPMIVAPLRPKSGKEP